MGEPEQASGGTVADRGVTGRRRISPVPGSAPATAMINPAAHPGARPCGGIAIRCPASQASKSSWSPGSQPARRRTSTATENSAMVSNLTTAHRRRSLRQCHRANSRSRRDQVTASATAGKSSS